MRLNVDDAKERLEEIIELSKKGERIEIEDNGQVVLLEPFVHEDESEVNDI